MNSYGHRRNYRGGRDIKGQICTGLKDSNGEHKGDMPKINWKWKQMAEAKMAKRFGAVVLGKCKI